MTSLLLILLFNLVTNCEEKPGLSLVLIGITPGDLWLLPFYWLQLVLLLLSFCLYFHSRMSVVSAVSAVSKVVVMVMVMVAV